MNRESSLAISQFLSRFLLPSVNFLAVFPTYRVVLYKKSVGVFTIDFKVQNRYWTAWKRVKNDRESGTFFSKTWLLLRNVQIVKKNVNRTINRESWIPSGILIPRFFHETLASSCLWFLRPRQLGENDFSCFCAKFFCINSASVVVVGEGQQRQFLCKHEKYNNHPASW